MRASPRRSPKETNARVLGIDTSVLVRLLTTDDPKQATLSRTLIKKAAKEAPAVINLVVLAELAWVLKSQHGHSHQDVCRAISALLDNEDFAVEPRDVAALALADADSNGCSFADSLIAALNYALGCSTTATFDNRASGRLDGMSAVEENL